MPAVQTATSLSDILRWWAMQMRGWLPQRNADARRTVLALNADPDGPMTMALWPAGRYDGTPSATPESAADIGRLRALSGQAKGRIVIAVPDDALLDTTIDLPASAERHLADIVRFEIDRVTPFRADEVLFDTRIMRRLSGKIAVRLRLAPATLVTPAQTVLAGAGLRAGAIVSERDGRTLPLAAPRKKHAPLRWIVGGGCLAVLLAAPFVHQQVALSETESHLEDAGPATRLAETLRARLDRALHGPAALAAEMRATGALPDILGRLSDALPDDTYLTALTLKRRHLEFNGLSADAPALIGRLDAAHFANTALSGPVLRTPDGKREVFSARADVPSDARADVPPDATTNRSATPKADMAPEARADSLRSAGTGAAPGAGTKTSPDATPGAQDGAPQRHPR